LSILIPKIIFYTYTIHWASKT